MTEMLRMPEMHRKQVESDVILSEAKDLLNARNDKIKILFTE